MSNSPTPDTKKHIEWKAWEILQLKIAGKPLPEKAYCFNTGSQVYIYFESIEYLQGEYGYTCTAGVSGLNLVLWDKLPLEGTK